MCTNDGPYDFFVSYAREDNKTGWITHFVEELLVEHRRFAAGRELKPFFDKHAITTGADWQLYLAHGVSHSRLFLAFISPNYFASEWCRKEWRAWIDAEIAQHILTVGVRPIYIVEVPGLTGKGHVSDQQLAGELARLSALTGRDAERLLAETPGVLKQLRRRQLSENETFCDVKAFFDAGLDALRRGDLRRVLNELARDLDHHAELLARADASLSTVPTYNAKFTGRLDELLALRERLIRDDRTGVIYGINGLGGIGKTELAYTYAHAYASAYPGGRFLIRCESQTSLRDAVLGQDDFVALFHDGISDVERLQPGTFFAAVIRCLRERIERLGHILVVLDNVSNLALLDPQETDTLTVLGQKLHLLATTRLVPPAAGRGNWLALGRLPEEDALDLLEKYRPFADDAEREAARSIAKRLGGFTLTVELVAAWLVLDKQKAVSYAGFLQRLGIEEFETLEALAEDQDVKLRRHNDERRLGAVLGPTLAALKNPAEKRALEYAAFLAPDHVVLPWLRALVSADFSEVAQPPRPGYPDAWQVIVARLTSLTLFMRPDTESSEPRLVTVHRMVQDWIRSKLAPGEREARRQAVEALVRQRVDALENTSQWSEARWELEPIEALALVWAEPSPEDGGAKHPLPANPLASWLLNLVAARWYELAEWAKAEPLMRRALAIDEQSYGKDHPDVARDLNNLAQLLQATNRLEEAEPLMRRALAIDEQSYGKDHPRVAIDLNNLALLLKATNRLEEAEPLMRRALAIDEQSYGKDHPRVAIRLNNLAQLLKATNRLEEAEPLMRRALAIDEQSYGKDHPRVAIRLNNLAQLLKATNRLEEAEPLMRRALAIDEQSYGKDHPRVARDLNNLAALLQATNRLEEAEPLMRRALAIDEQSYGKDHPNVARDLNNLAALLQATNRLEEAEPLMRRALAIDEQSYGKDHPDVARDLNNLAQLLQATNRLEEAEPLMRRALAIDEQSYGKDHPRVAIDLNNLALLLKATNRLEEAEPLMRRALAIDEQSYGKDHPRVARDLNNLAALLQATNRLEEAEPLMRRALAIDEQSYGKDHPDVAIDLNNLAQLLQATNRLEEAEPLMRRALAIDEQSYGKDHPNVARDLNNLAALLQATNRLEEAEPLMRRALAIDEQSYGKDHPRVAIDLNNLAALLQATNRLEEAEPLMRRALAIDEQSYGKDHPRVAIDLNNLAQLLQATNRLEEAEPLMRRALAIDEQSYGKDHPNVAIDLNNLAQLLQATNRLEEAEPLMRRALAIDEQSYGKDHPDVARDLNNLAQLLQATNRLEEAEPLMRRAVEILLKFTKSTGHRHPHLQPVVDNYSQLLETMGRSPEEVRVTLDKLGRTYGVDLFGSGA